MIITSRLLQSRNLVPINYYSGVHLCASAFVERKTTWKKDDMEECLSACRTVKVQKSSTLKCDGFSTPVTLKAQHPATPMIYQADSGCQ
jgi:hypothetical protein